MVLGLWCLPLSRMMACPPRRHGWIACMLLSAAALHQQIPAGHLAEAEAPTSKGPSICEADSAASRLPLLVPSTLQGEVLDDCVQRDGAWSCLTAAREWQECQLDSEPPIDIHGQLLVAQVRGQQWGVQGLLLLS